MKKVLSDADITFKITTERVVNLTPDTATYVQDDEAALLVSRLGMHVTVTEPTDEELTENGFGVIGPIEAADAEKAEEIVPPSEVETLADPVEEAPVTVTEPTDPVDLETVTNPE